MPPFALVKLDSEDEIVIGRDSEREQMVKHANKFISKASESNIDPENNLRSDEIEPKNNLSQFFEMPK